jgi:Protein of unknown function (DUF433)
MITTFITAETLQKRNSNFTKIIFMDTTLLNRITSNSKILAGKPVIRGMRISVEQLIKMLARGIAYRYY